MDLYAFQDELEKIAITTEGLAKLTRLVKLRSLRMPHVQGPQALTSQSMKPHIAALEGTPMAEASRKMLSQAGGKVLLPRKGDALDQLTTVMRSVGIDEEMMPKMYAAASKLKKAPEGRRALEGIVKGHELEELAKAHKGFIGPHAAGVIPTEHNILSTLPAKAKPAGEFMRALRREHPVGEAGLFEKATARPGGQTITYGEGPRLSRHAVKRVGENMRRLEKERLRTLYESIGLSPL